MRYSSTSIRISAFFAASFVPFGIQLPFFPILLASRGLDETAIAMIVAIPMVLRVTTASALGALADRLGERRRALVLYSAATLAGALALVPAQSFWALALATAAMSLPWNGILPVSDAVATSVVRRGEGVYGRMRVWGSIAFVAANLAAGVVATWGGADGVLAFLILGFAGQLAVGFVIPRERGGEDALPKREPALAALRAIASDRRLMAILIGTACLQASHAMLYGFSSLHWAGLGFSGSEIGVLWAMGVTGEIVLFTFSAMVLARVGARGLLVVAVGGAVVRWCLFPLIGASMPLWLALQGLHAASFAATHLGSIHILTHAVEERRAATAQGLMVSINGLAMALATLASGPLYRAHGGAGFVAMAGVAALGGVVLLIASRLQPQSAGEGGNIVEPS